MSRTIAIAGKGGVGKSTIATQMIRSLSENGTVLAIDADPNSNLPDKLGMEVTGTIGSIRSEVVNDPDVIPAGMSKHEYMYQKVRMMVSESDRTDLLVMGRPEGSGCYCFTNNVLKECFHDLAPKYDHVVIDNEAGMEHLSRKVIPSADVLILVSDPTIIGVRTAGRLKDLSQEIGIEVKRTILIINNMVSSPNMLTAEAEELGFNEIFLIPHDDAISETAMRTTVLDIPKESEFVRSVEAIISVL